MSDLHLGFIDEEEGTPDTWGWYVIDEEGGALCGPFTMKDEAMVELEALKGAKGMPASQTEGMGGGAARLLSCPFCGGAPTLHPHSPDHMLGAWVSCSTCGLESPTETGQSVEAAVQHWNTRAALTPPETAEAVPVGYVSKWALPLKDLPAELRRDAWRRGDVPLYDRPALATDDRERLVEALRAADSGLEAMIRLSEMGLEESLREPEESGNFASFEQAKRCLATVRAALATEASR